MPNDVKAIVSAVTLIAAVLFAYWSSANGKPHLFWLVVGFGVFAVVAMWVFPEASGKQGGPIKKGGPSDGQRDQA